VYGVCHRNLKDKITGIVVQQCIQIIEKPELQK